MQLDDGRYFLHEHPALASSWIQPCITNLLNRPEVDKVRCDQCQYDQEVSSGKDKGSPIMKPTCFMSNAPELLTTLQRRCTGRNGQCSRRRSGAHVLCSGPIAKMGQKFPRALCAAILRGMTKQLKHDGVLKPGCVGLQAVDEEDETQQLRCDHRAGFE